MPPRNYPKLHIRSKSDLAKHISHNGFSRADAQALISDVLKNHDHYWRDNLRESKPLDDKWVRSAKKQPLDALLKKINLMLLAPHDNLIPDFIFGGKQNTSNVKAAKYLQGTKNKRTLLKLDLKRFFEQVSEERVIDFFIHACNCSYKGAELIAKLCCIPFGAKGSRNSKKTIARGFATSSRLAVWCNLDLFKKMDELVRKRLAGHDPRIAIYVDDIGVTAVDVKKSDLLKVAYDLKRLCETHKRPLKLNDEKTQIVRHDEGMEHLGVALKKRGLAMGRKPRGKKAALKRTLSEVKNVPRWKKIKRSLKGISQYQSYIKRIEKED